MQVLSQEVILISVCGEEDNADADGNNGNDCLHQHTLKSMRRVMATSTTLMPVGGYDLVYVI